jgi:hypothetical protein
MIPESVRKAWQELPENRKAAVNRLCAKKQPFIFNRLIEAAGMKNFRRDSLVNRKAGSAARLDKALFSAEEGQLAADFLVAYFTELAPEVNDQYLEMLEAAENEEPESKLKIYAQLFNQHQDWPFLQLYLATALWVEEFAESDIEKVKVLAAELA